MTKKKTYNRRRANWKKNLVWTFVTLVIMGLLYMAVERKKNAEIVKVSISIKKIEGDRDLVTKKGVKQMFRNYLGFDIEGATVQDLNLMDLEAMLLRDERIRSAEVYVDKHENLFVEIVQKKPIVRVFSRDGSSYYLDEEGREIPAYRGSTIRVPVASGDIEPYDPALLADGRQSHLKDVYTLAKYIREDDFLEALIEQIDVKETGEVVMVPKVGRQKLDFGEVEDLENRFEKLKVLYKGGMDKVGWRKYDVLTLRYDPHAEEMKDDYYMIVGKKRKK